MLLGCAVRRAVGAGAGLAGLMIVCLVCLAASQHAPRARASWGTLEDINTRLSWRKRGCGKRIVEDDKKHQLDMQLHYCVTKPTRNASTLRENERRCRELQHLDGVQPGLGWGRMSAVEQKLEWVRRGCTCVGIMPVGSAITITHTITDKDAAVYEQNHPADAIADMPAADRAAFASGARVPTAAPKEQFGSSDTAALKVGATMKLKNVCVSSRDGILIPAAPVAATESPDYRWHGLGGFPRFGADGWLDDSSSGASTTFKPRLLDWDVFRNHSHVRFVPGRSAYTNCFRCQYNCRNPAHFLMG